MNQTKYFTIKATIEIIFKDPQLRDISYNSFFPEFKRLKMKRSIVFMEKKSNISLLFQVESQDITAFRATLNEIISFGKIIDNTLTITDNS
jgi:tRNA threonylcarbamoyladenosine modification (KEOPS) complex  Pcc1 subunit